MAPNNEQQTAEAEVVTAEAPELSEEQQAHQDKLLGILKDRQAIADKLNGQKISDAFITIVQRAEMHSKLTGKDFYISTVENGVAFFPEEEYDNLVEKTISDLRSYLTSQNIPQDKIETEVDTYAANLVIHYVDFKSFSDEEIQETRKQFGTPKEPKEIEGDK